MKPLIQRLGITPDEMQVILAGKGLEGIGDLRCYDCSYNEHRDGHSDYTEKYNESLYDDLSYNDIYQECD